MRTLIIAGLGLGLLLSPADAATSKGNTSTTAPTAGPGITLTAHDQCLKDCIAKWKAMVKAGDTGGLNYGKFMTLCLKQCPP